MKKLLSIILSCLLVCIPSITNGTISASENDIITNDIPTNIVSEAVIEIAQPVKVEVESIQEQKVETNIALTVVEEPITIEPIEIETIPIIYKSDEEYARDFIEAYDTGNYELTLDSAPNDAEWISNRIELSNIISAYNSKMCSTSNICSNTYYYKDGQYYISTNGIIPYYTKEELVSLEAEAKEIANTVYNQLHDDSLTEYEQAIKYLNYFYNRNMRFPAEVFEENGPVSDQERMDRTLYNTLYAIFVNNSANCNAACGAYNLLMDIEGITAYGLKVHNHIVSYLVLDGEEYFCDWINHIGIKPIDELLDYNTIDEFYNLDYIRSLL